MEELELFTNRLKEYLIEKIDQIKDDPNFYSSHTQDTISNRKNEISAYEDWSKKVDGNPFSKNDILAEFEKKYYEIRLNIESIEPVA